VPKENTDSSTVCRQSGQGYNEQVVKYRQQYSLYTIRSGLEQKDCASNKWDLLATHTCCCKRVEHQVRLRSKLDLEVISGWNKALETPF